MTRDQDFERRLTDWLASGPSVAPAEVVEGAVERAAARPHRPAAWVRIRSSLEILHQPGAYGRGWPRVVVVVATMVVLVTLSLLTVVPLVGGPGPAPSMDPASVRPVEGVITVVGGSGDVDRLERVIRIDVSDERIDGEARQILRVDQGAGISRSVGLMRLTNDWGTWEGTLSGVSYPDGSALEYGWLRGSDAYEGYSYFHATYRPSVEAERAVEGAIWPGEPPPMPDPSLLP